MSSLLPSRSMDGSDRFVLSPSFVFHFDVCVLRRNEQEMCFFFLQNVKACAHQMFTAFVRIHLPFTSRSLAFCLASRSADLLVPYLLLVKNAGIQQAQFGYTCAETLTGLLSWVCYWVYPLIVFSFAARMCCFRYVPPYSHLTTRFGSFISSTQPNDYFSRFLYTWCLFYIHICIFFCLFSFFLFFLFSFLFFDKSVSFLFCYVHAACDHGWIHDSVIKCNESSQFFLFQTSTVFCVVWFNCRCT